MKRLMPAGFFQTDTGSVPNSDAYLWTHHNIIFLYHPEYGKAFPLFWGKCYCDASVQSGKLSMLTKFLSLTRTHTYKPKCTTCSKIVSLVTKTHNNTEKHCMNLNISIFFMLQRKRQQPIKPLNVNHKTHNLLSSFKKPPPLSHCKFIFIALHGYLVWISTCLFFHFKSIRLQKFDISAMASTLTKDSNRISFWKKKINSISFLNIYCNNDIAMCCVNALGTQLLIW